MDGAPGVTQPVVPPGADFLYDFVAPDAGTFWYHPHERAFEQMARGLYGALVGHAREVVSVDPIGALKLANEGDDPCDILLRKPRHR